MFVEMKCSHTCIKSRESWICFFFFAFFFQVHLFFHTKNDELLFRSVSKDDKKSEHFSTSSSIYHNEESSIHTKSRLNTTVSIKQIFFFWKRTSCRYNTQKMELIDYVGFLFDGVRAKKIPFYIIFLSFLLTWIEHITLDCHFIFSIVPLDEKNELINYWINSQHFRIVSCYFISIASLGYLFNLRAKYLMVTFFVRVSRKEPKKWSRKLKPIGKKCKRHFSNN